MVVNCWLGRRLKASVVCSMRPANAPAAFVKSCPCTVPEFTNEALMTETPAVRSGICEAVKAGVHGFVGSLGKRGAPLGRQLGKLLLACNMRNELRIGAASISLMS